MKKKTKLNLGLAVCLIFFTSAINVTGTTTLINNGSAPLNTDVINERFIEIPDSSVVVRLWEIQQETGTNIPFYAISIDGGNTYVRTVQPSYELGLRYTQYDPKTTTPTIPQILAAGDDIHLYIVQFVTQPLEQYHNAITALGGHVRQYIAQYAYLVEMTENVRSQVEQLPYIRWIGHYQPAYRLEEYMLDNLENAQEMYPLQRYHIQVHTIEQKQILSDRITTLGGIVDKTDAGKYLIIASLTPEQLFTVVRWDEINFIDRWSPLEPDMNNAREIGGANYIETIAGYDGEGVRGESFDTGFNLAHVDLQHHPLIVHGTQGSVDSHGSACIGICFGDGTGNPLARGMLPRGQGIVAWYSYVGLTGPSRYTHTSELLEDPYYAVFQTASVGSDRTTQYTTISADTDVTLFDFDIVHCQSQSNAGDQMSRPQAWAKNIISGGGIYHYDTLTKTDDMWNHGASIGPATDGRIKPTFTHFYDQILTTSSGGPTSYTTSFGGTSGATPIIAGHVGLFFDMWADGIFGNDVTPGGNVFENKAHMTTAKAMLVNTAEQYPFTGTTGDKIRMHQGWGMPNLQTMYDLRENFYIIDETDILEPFEVSTHTAYVESGSPYLKVTMTYADPPGNPSVQTQHRINDLTLKVISPSNVVYWGNNGLLTGVWSEPGGNADTKNTVECVFVENPECGGWTIEVSGDEIIQDSHVETTELDADYALVISPVLSGPIQPTLDGPVEGYVGQDLDFTVVTTDPGNLDVSYWVDWGDGTNSGWVGPYASGQTATVSHSWNPRGNYTLKAKAKNSLGTESAWSQPHTITILAPTVEINLSEGGLFKVKGFIENTGAICATNISWEMEFGKNVFVGKLTNGSITSIAPGETAEIATKFALGLGYTTLTLRVTTPETTLIEERQALALLFYIKVMPY